MRIYLNTSAWNRPFDDHSAPRVRQEAEAVAAILELATTGRVHIVGSEYLDFEAAQDPDPDRANRIRVLLGGAASQVKLGPAVVARAREIERFGLRGLDALHLAAAEAGGAQMLVTTDERMLRRVQRLQPASPARAVLPGEALQVLTSEEER